MEFENTTPASDEDRRFAEAKRLTLQPIHADVTPDVLLDSRAAASVEETQLAAVANYDTEEATARILPTKSLLDDKASERPQAYKLMVGVSIGVAVFTGLAIFAFIK